jgi:hypothetical protein
VDVPLIELEAADPLELELVTIDEFVAGRPVGTDEFCAARAATLLSRACAADVDGGEDELVVAEDGVVDVVGFVVVPALVVVAGAVVDGVGAAAAVVVVAGVPVVAGVLVVVVVPAVVVVPVDEVPVVLVDGTADR